MTAVISPGFRQTSDRAVIVACDAGYLPYASVVAGQLAFTYLPIMNTIFGSRPLTLAEGALIIALGAASFVLLEFEKHFIRHRFRND